MSKKGKRAVSPIIATILLVAITVVLAAVLYVLVSGYLGSTGAKPSSIGMASSTPTSNTCVNSGGGAGSTGTVYSEGVSITSTSSTVTTSTFGVKVVPTSGTSNPSLTLGNPGAAAAACTGWWATLASNVGTVQACWSAEDSAAWATPVGGVCTSASTVTLAASVTVTGGMTLTIYVTTSNPAGAYTVQVFGIGGSTVSGSADL